MSRRKDEELEQSGWEERSEGALAGFTSAIAASGHGLVSQLLLL